MIEENVYQLQTELIKRINVKRKKKLIYFIYKIIV